MLTHRGFSAWVVSEGEALSEHLISVDANSHRVQCWIPCEAGKTFSVYWKDLGGKVDSCAYIGLDGFLVPGRFLFGNGIAFRKGVRSGPTTEKPFMFSKVEETDTNSIPEVLNQDSGMITVKIKLVERWTHRPNNEVQDLPSMQHGKYSVGQLHIGYGNEKKTWAQCPTTWHFKPTHTHVTFIFRYRSREFLIAQGIMPTEPVSNTPKCQRKTVLSAPASENATNETASRLPVTPSPTPSPRTRKIGMEHLSPSMKKAFYPGMAGLGRMRPAKGVTRTVSSQALDQTTWQGLISFDDSESTIFATQDGLHEEGEPGQAREPVASEGHCQNIDYHEHEGRGC
ncbi:hypothetical protein PILCRDRAFT_86241 [Piloderma croceum F 1598]|uniref:DUF7918 domain-containing protein n=1 Tax=Piloderma croceum (strain F 1598) TaxID=765440 RepID=A0A0C3G988_PILCF|nr:hypothetical protein PILCRDRAFT_86241 [Piloderma croceum F 1598]